jgi:hypothetical protein
MSVKEFLVLEKLGAGIVSVTVSLILFLGMFIYASVMNSNPYQAQADALTPSGVESRSPASIVSLSAEVERVVLGSSPETAAAQAPAQKEAEVISLVCINGNTASTITSQAKQIRLRGPVCGGKEVSDIEVINRTNGFRATIFQTDKVRYSSDYIHLAQGDNQIHLSYMDAEGEARSAELTISRAKAQ